MSNGVNFCLELKKSSGNITVLVLVMTLLFLGISTTSVFGEKTITQWDDGYTVGVLNSDQHSTIPVKVTIFSEDALKLEWEKPLTQKNEIIVGYEILRKEMNTEYSIITDNINSNHLSYIDEKLPEGYYGYKVIPVIEKEKPDRITMHGIQRDSNIFSTYMKGQELLAKQFWDGEKIQSKLPDSFSFDFEGVDRMNNPEVQRSLSKELLKASEIFNELFQVKINH